MSASKRGVLIRGGFLYCWGLFSQPPARANWWEVPDPDWVEGLGPEWTIFHWHVESVGEADAYWNSEESSHRRARL